MRVSALYEQHFPQASFVTADKLAATQSRTTHSREPLAVMLLDAKYGL